MFFADGGKPTRVVDHDNAQHFLDRKNYGPPVIHWGAQLSQSRISPIDLVNKDFMNHTYGVLKVATLERDGFVRGEETKAMILKFNNAIIETLVDLAKWESNSATVIEEHDIADGRITTISIPSNLEKIFIAREHLLNTAKTIFGDVDGAIISSALDYCPSFRGFKNPFTIEVKDVGDQISIHGAGNFGKFVVSTIPASGNQGEKKIIRGQKGGGVSADRSMFSVSQQESPDFFESRWGYLIPR